MLQRDIKNAAFRQTAHFLRAFNTLDKISECKNVEKMKGLTTHGLSTLKRMILSKLSFLLHRFRKLFFES